MTRYFSTEAARWSRIAGFLLFLFAAALPHSIALSQSLLAAVVLVWIAGLVVARRRPASTRLAYPILLYLAATILAAAFSLEPRVSFTKLDAAALVLIIPVVADLVRSRRQAIALALVLLFSAGVSAAPVLWQKAAGQGIEIAGTQGDHPLARRLGPQDVVLRCDGQEIEDPRHFRQILADHELTKPLVCDVMRGGILPATFTIRPGKLHESPPETWKFQAKMGRSIRARGTYSHFVTYAEVMLQLSALAFGLWLAFPQKTNWRGAGLLLLLAMLAGALAASLTRASLAALALAAGATVWLTVNWRFRLLAIALLVFVLVGANQLLIQMRGVGFYSPDDLSIQYRRMMWRDGWRLIQDYPVFGIGMDTVLHREQELELQAYKQMGLKGHFHSTPIQIAVERGLLGLASWLWLMGAYLWMLLRLILRTLRGSEWQRQGLALGIFGASLGFLASGLVHYNFGDSEVVMVFWLLAGVAVGLNRELPAGTRQVTN